MGSSPPPPQSSSWPSASALHRVAPLANLIYQNVRHRVYRPSTNRAVLPHDVKAFVLYTLTRDQWYDNMEDVLQVVSTSVVPTLSARDNFEDAFENASGCQKSGVCGVLWQKDEIAYKCRTCERDPTCVICDRCFRLGDHTGHEYAMVRTGGGCCDCGDPQAWRRSGFCSEHKGPSSEHDDPTADLQPEFLHRLTHAVHITAAVCLSLVVDTHRFLNDSNTTRPVSRINAMLKWLTCVARGDGVCRAIGKILTEVAAPWLLPYLNENRVGKKLEISAEELKQHSWLSLMLRMDGMGRLPMDLQSNAQALYFKLMTDTVFKRCFFLRFVENYERYIHAQVARRYIAQRQGNAEDRVPFTDIVENFSVQLFTVPALVPLMIKPGGLLDILLQVLLNLFEVSSVAVRCYEPDIPYDKSAFAAKFPSARETFTDLKSSASRQASASHSRQQSSQPSSRTYTSGASSNDQLRRQVVLDLVSDVVRDRDHFTENPSFQPGNVRRSRPIDIPTPAGDPSPSGDSDPHSATEVLDESNNQSTTVQQVGMDDNIHVTSTDAPALDVAEPAPNGQPVTELATVLAEEENDNTEGRRVFGNETLLEQLRQTDDSDAEELAEGAVMFDETQDPVNFFFLTDDGLTEEPEALGRAINVLFQVGANPALDVETVERAIPVNPLSSMREVARVYQQIKAFEDGMQVKPASFTKILSEDPPSSGLLAAITKARKRTTRTKAGTGPLSHPMRIEWANNNSRIDTETLLWRVIRDLIYVLSHEAAAFHFLHERPEPLRLFLRAVSMAQGMNPAARRFGDHEPAWSADSSRTFALEVEFYRLLDLLAVAFCAQDASKLVNVLGSSCTDIDLPSSRRRITKMFRCCINEWFFREQGIEALSTYDDEEFTVAHSQSVHFPLHRCLSLFAHHSIRIDNIDVASALALDDEETRVDDARRLSLHLIRIHSYFAQIGAGMWRRNGRAVADQAILYSSAFCSEWFVDLDLFLVQCCTLITGPETFIRDAKNIFRIGDLSAVLDLTHLHVVEAQKCRACVDIEGIIPGNSELQEKGKDGSDQLDDSFHTTPANDSNEQFGLLPLAPKHLVVNGTIDSSRVVENMGNAESDIAQFAQTIVEEFLVFIVRVSSERMRCGQSEEASLRSRLVQVLAAKDKMYSFLIRTCSYSSYTSNGTKVVLEPDGNGAETTEALIEATLNEVAEHILPKGMKQGTYRLRDEVWREFDPFCPHLSRGERCSAENRHAAVCKRESRQPQVIPMERICDRPIYAQFEGLHNIPLVVCGGGNNAVATQTLLSCIPSSGVARHIEGALTAALHLLCMAVEVKSQSKSQQSLISFLGPLSDDGSFTSSAIWAACSLQSCKLHRPTNALHLDLYGDYRPVLQRIVCETFVQANHDLKRLLVKRAPHYLSSVVEGSSDDVTLSGVSVSEQRRQFFLRKKREQQAAAMERIRRAQASFAKHIDDEEMGDGEPSTVKKQKKSERPLEVEELSSGLANIESTTVDFRPQSHLNDPECAKYAPRRRQQCVLCHGEEHTDGKDGLLGLIGFHQVTKIPAITKRRCSAGYKPNVTVWNSFIKNDSGDESSDVAMGVKTPVSKSSDGISEAVSDQSSSEAALAEVGILSSMDQRMLSLGVEEGHNVHVSLCGHAVHVVCFELYFQSLSHSRSLHTAFAGDNVVDLEKKEFLCPVCRRLSNLIWPMVESSAPFTEGIRGGISTPLTKEKWIAERNIGIFCSEDLKDVSEHREMENGVRLSGMANESDKTDTFASWLLDLMKTFRFAIKEAWTLDPAWQLPVHDVLAGFAGSVVSTAACVEIGARLVGWNDSMFLHSRKSLKMLFRVTRDHLLVESDVRLQALRILWKHFWQDNGPKRQRDPFVCMCLLLLLWSEKLTLDEVKMIVRVVFDKIVMEWDRTIGQEAVVLTKGLLFLRRAIVLTISVVEDESEETHVELAHYGRELDMKAGKAEVMRLMDYFKIDNIGYRQLVTRTNEDATSVSEELKVSTLPRRMGLIEMPQEFRTILEELGKSKCSMCGTEPKNRVICLVCGDVICSSSKDCESHGIPTHASKCGAGIGVFLSMKKTTIDIVRGSRKIRWGSPYLDVHGEEDPELTRGKALLLSQERYSLLERLWVFHAFDQDSYILRHSQRPNVHA